MKDDKTIKLFCFSPLVMITTFLIEVFSACFLLFKYRMTFAAQIIISILSFLALFQLAEYMVCQRAMVLSSLTWARIGYAAITLLPPLGLHLGSTIAKKKNTTVIRFAYGSAFLFTLFFTFIGQGNSAAQCLGNYVLFELAPYAVIPYTVYYYGWLFVGVYFFTKMRSNIEAQEQKDALLWLTIGYLAFIVPTTIVNIINPKTIAGIPSIMCGFAVCLALSLLFKVAPRILKESKATFIPAEKLLLVRQYLSDHKKNR